MLEDNERQRFIEYARQQIVSGKALIEQFAKSSLPGVADELTKRERLKLMAYQVVLNDLESISLMTIK